MNIEELARAAKPSIATVPHTIHGSDEVREETTLRVFVETQSKHDINVHPIRSGHPGPYRPLSLTLHGAKA